MTTPSDASPLDAQQLATLIKSEVLGQNAVADAFAAEFALRYQIPVAERPSSVFLLAGAGGMNDKTLIGSTPMFSLQVEREIYDLSDKAGSFPEMFFGSTHFRPGTAPTLVNALKKRPGLFVLLLSFDKADPVIILEFLSAWKTGTLRNNEGKDPPINGTTFVLTTDLAGESIGQLARRESDPDRLHIESLKLLLDAGFPAGVLTCIDRVFCLRSNTLGELARAQHQEYQEQVEKHGLQLEVGGIDARILIDAMYPPTGLFTAESGVDFDDLDRQLSEAKAQGVSVVRLVVGDENVLVIPMNEHASTALSSAPADAQQMAPPDTTKAED